MSEPRNNSTRAPSNHPPPTNDQDAEAAGIAGTYNQQTSVPSEGELGEPDALRANLPFDSTSPPSIDPTLTRDQEMLDPQAAFTTPVNTHNVSDASLSDVQANPKNPKFYDLTSIPGCFFPVEAKEAFWQVELGQNFHG